jgi:hypothetical protein
MENFQIKEEPSVEFVLILPHPDQIKKRIKIEVNGEVKNK